MATAVDTSSQSRTPTPPTSLLTASLVGAVYVLAALAVVFYAVPALWAEYVASQIGGNRLLEGALRVAVQGGAAVGLVAFGRALAGTNPPKGVRGGIFLMISAAFAVFFLTRAVGLWVESRVEGAPGQAVTAAVGLALLFGAYRLFTSPRGERWMIGLEEQGWFHASPYKRALGQKVRRLTILGILLVGGSGVYTLIFQGSLPDNWTITLPFTQKEGAPAGTHQTITLLTDAQYSVPLLLMGLTLWVAYRVVNLPTFAEFLIATEAEMNKVSWSSRKRLTQDTIVVLVTTIMMALFLLVVDLFWGWLLSRETVGVLPAKSTVNQKVEQNQEAKW
ncbi:MAG: preprotein translocase subunit SecE [Gemmataceae bacterium]|nr:preprotein translocase subunit SecE [Gemmataceae bacterium]